MKTLAAALLLLAACATQPASLPDDLRAAGFSVRDAGVVEQPFFAVPAHVYVVNEGDLQVYEFATAADAQAAAATVASNGMTIGTTKVGWMAVPHFFRGERTIVNYLGSDEKVLAELQRRFGPQFAGQ